MFKFDKLISMVIVLSLVGVVLTPIIAITIQPRPGAPEFMLGLVATAGFLIAMAIGLGVLVLASKSAKE
jgi:hypothetical protein